MTREKTLTKADIVEHIHKEVGLSKKDALDSLQFVLDEICNALQEHETVKISSFGRFSVRQKSERIGRNPKTGVEAVVSERNVVVFKPSQLLKQRVS